MASKMILEELKNLNLRKVKAKIQIDKNHHKK